MSTTSLSAAMLLCILSISGQSWSDCGRRSRDNYASSRIAGGSSSQLGEWPWQAMIYSSRPSGLFYTFCGGTILSEGWVMTAASCFQSNDIISVYVGKLYSDRTLLETGQQLVFVSNKYKHPQFTDTSTGNDVGLLRLSSKIKFTDNIQPVCLPPGTNYNVPSGTRCYISGWGHTSSSSSDISSNLRDADLKIQTESYCSNIYSQTYPRTLMCALESGTSTCQGDGGGPLVCERGNQTWYQYGIGSMSIDHCGTGPDFFTEVTEVYSWIQQTTGLNFPPPDGAVSYHRCGNFVWILTLVAMTSFHLN